MKAILMIAALATSTLLLAPTVATAQTVAAQCSESAAA
jgi:hypothetical protein